MDVIVTRKLSELRPHARNFDIFGDPRSVPEYEDIKQSIRLNGLQEPLVIKDDGTILSGHLRFQVLKELAAESNRFLHEVETLVRVHEDFNDLEDELQYLFDANIQRRQLTPGQIAKAYAALLNAAPPETKSKGGRPPKGTSLKGLTSKRISTREKIAKVLHISRKTADAITLIFSTPGVPTDVLAQVDAREISITFAAEAVQQAVKEALRKNPDMEVVQVDPVDVWSYIDTPPRRRVTVSGLVRGDKPVENEPLYVAGQPMYSSSIQLTVPQPYVPTQKVKDMLVHGVEYDKEDTYRWLPLHESLNRMRVHLQEVLDRSNIVREEKVVESLERIIERCAQYLRLLGKDVTVLTGPQGSYKMVPETLYEKLVMFRLILEDDDPNLDPTVFRSVLLDIATRARDKANAAKKPQQNKRSVVSMSSKVLQKDEVKTAFENDLDFIYHVVGEEVINALGLA